MMSWFELWAFFLLFFLLLVGMDSGFTAIIDKSAAYFPMYPVRDRLSCEAWSIPTLEFLFLSCRIVLCRAEKSAADVNGLSYPNLVVCC